MFNSREEVGKLLFNKIKEDIENLNDILVVALMDKGIEIAKGFCEEEGLDFEIMATERLENKGLIFGICGKNEGQIIFKNGIKETKITEEEIRKIIEGKQRKAKEREKEQRKEKEEKRAEGKTVIIVSDIAIAGDKITLACRSYFKKNPRKILVALPLCSKEVYQRIEKECDGVYVLEVAELVLSVSQFYI